MFLGFSVSVILIQTLIFSQFFKDVRLVETKVNSSEIAELQQASEFVEADCECHLSSCRCKCPPGYGLYSTIPISLAGSCKACHCGRSISCTFSNVNLLEWHDHKPTKKCQCEEDDIEIDGICVGFCSQTPCKNGGTCRETDNGYTCMCPFGFYGTNCDLKIPCLPNPCQNEGLCQATGLSGYRCECSFGYFGSHCTERNSHCDSSPCANGGTCLEVFGIRGVSLDYRCFCTDDYVGLKCEFPLTSSPDRFAMSVGLPIFAVIFFMISTCYVLVRLRRRTAPSRTLLSGSTNLGLDDNDLPPAYSVQRNREAEFVHYPPPSYARAVEMEPPSYK